MRPVDVLGLLAAPLVGPLQVDRPLVLEGEPPLPVALYLPPEPSRWIVFSTGYGSSRFDYQPLALAWREAGFAVAVVQHPGSDRRAAVGLLGAYFRLRREERSVLQHRVHTRRDMLQRPRDLERVMNFLERTFGVESFWLAGHSFGAYTVFAVAGVPPRLPEGDTSRFSDPRVAGLLAMSFHPPGQLFGPEAYARLACPSLLLTGSRDSTIDGATPSGRLEVVPHLPGHVVVGSLQEADHYTFAGFGPGWEVCGPALLEVTTEYWRALARGEAPGEQPVPGWSWFRSRGGGPVPGSGGR